MIGEDVLPRYHYDNNNDDTDNNTHNNDILEVHLLRSYSFLYDSISSFLSFWL